MAQPEVSPASVYSPPPGEATPTSAAWSERRSVVVTAQILFVLLLLGLWELASGTIVDPFFISAPSRVAPILYEWATSGFLWQHIVYTIVNSVIGFVLGSLAAIALGVWLGTHERLYQVFDPILNAFYTIPKIALAPLLIIWFGLDRAPKVVLAAVIVFFLVFNATIAGLRQVDRDLVDIVRIMGGDRRTVVTKVVLPSVALHVLNGMRMSFPYAIHGAIVAEIIASNKGIGYMLEHARGLYNMNMMYAALVAMMVVAVIVVALIDSLGTKIPKADL